jgi:hypothetical protein
MAKIDEMQVSSGRVYDENSVVQNPVDTITGGIKQLTTDHALIHAGKGFSISGIFANVANAAVVNYAFKTPTAASGKYIHLKFKEFFATANKIRMDFYEAPTAAPTNGTDIASINRRRIGTPTVTAMQAIKSAMDINVAGATTLNTEQFTSTTGRSLDLEFVLKPDTWYIRTFTNGTGSAADISFFEFWYEETAG